MVTGDPSPTTVIVNDSDSTTVIVIIVVTIVILFIIGIGIFWWFYRKKKMSSAEEKSDDKIHETKKISTINKKSAKILSKFTEVEIHADVEHETENEAEKCGKTTELSKSAYINVHPLYIPTNDLPLPPEEAYINLSLPPLIKSRESTEILPLKRSKKSQKSLETAKSTTKELKPVAKSTTKEAKSLMSISKPSKSETKFSKSETTKTSKSKTTMKSVTKTTTKSVSKSSISKNSKTSSSSTNTPKTAPPLKDKDKLKPAKKETNKKPEKKLEKAALLKRK